MTQSVKIIILAFVFACSACSTNKLNETVKSTETVIQCKAPRPNICTREYMPVCAIKFIGINCMTAPCPSTEEQTYATGCTACADEKVIHYSTGACEK